MKQNDQAIGRKHIVGRKLKWISRKAWNKNYRNEKQYVTTGANEHDTQERPSFFTQDCAQWKQTKQQADWRPNYACVKCQVAIIQIGRSKFTKPYKTNDNQVEPNSRPIEDGEEEGIDSEFVLEHARGLV